MKKPRRPWPESAIACRTDLLAPYNSYGQPPFVARGYYVDEPFVCSGCGIEQLWTATQQKWWYEVAKGHVESRAKLCRNCRRKKQAESAEGLRTHLEGVTKRMQR